MQNKILMIEEFIDIIISKLPDNYILSIEDKYWIKIAAAYWNGGKENIDLFNAFKEATDRHSISICVDPYELLIDAEVCENTVSVIQK